MWKDIASLLFCMSKTSLIRQIGVLREEWEFHKTGRAEGSIFICFREVSGLCVLAYENFPNAI